MMRKRQPLELTRSFKQEIRGITLRQVRLAAVLSIVIYLAFGILDKIVYPSFLKTFLLLRFLNTLIAAAVLAISFLSVGKKHPTLLGMLIALTLCASNSIMVGLTGGHDSGYYVGIIVVVLATLMLFPWRPLEFGFLCIIVHSIYLIATSVLNPVTNWAVFINNNFFLICTYTLIVTTSYFSRRFQFQSFKDRHELTIAKINLEQAYCKLQELDHLKTQFFANISHELRTPLTLILAPTESMMKEELGKLETPQAKALEVVRDNALRLLKLMNQLLDFIKIDAEQFKLHIRTVEVGTFLKEIQDAMSPLAHQKGLKLEFNTDGLLNAEFDRDQMEKVLLNLVYNAIKFTPKGGNVEVSARKVSSPGLEARK